MSHAGGKVILCGEHAVVYGQDAIAVGLPTGVSAKARVAAEFGMSIDARELAPSDLSVEALTQLHAAVTKDTVTKGTASKNAASKVHVQVNVTMPLGVGLGGSAAMAVAIAKAIAEVEGKHLQVHELLEVAAVWERVFHGNPSGVDAAAAALGGCMRFNRRLGATALSLHTPLHLAIAVAGPPSLTKAMVERVAEHQRRDPRRFEGTLLAIQTLVAEAEQCLRTGALEHLGHLLSENHRHLCSWQLSTQAIDSACALAIEAGALGAKLTGAGGGGCVLALCLPDTLEAIHAEWRKHGFETLSATISNND